MSIEVRNLFHIYDEKMPTEWPALTDISFCAQKGEIVSIVGHTGSGKSTLAQHLNGLIIPQRGEVIVDGMRIAAKTPELRKIRRLVGLVFQYPEQQIFAESVEEEISFSPLNWGIKGDELKERVQFAMASIGLDEELLPQNPFELSGGQKRRVAIASVLAADPEYLVLDEPTAGLDASGAAELVSLLESFRREGRMVIHITHDLELALNISDKIIILAGGKIFAQGTPGEIAETLCHTQVQGLTLPDVLLLSSELRGAGRINGITWNPFRLAEMLGNAG